MEELTVTLSVSECASNCQSCVTSGAKKCDTGKCNDGFGLDSTDSTCKGEQDILVSLEVSLAVVTQLYLYVVSLCHEIYASVC